MKKNLIASKILPLLSILMCISLGCRKDKDEPDPDNSTSCKIVGISSYGNYVYDQFGRLKRDEAYEYIYDSNSYLTTMKTSSYPAPPDEYNNEVTTYEYEDGLLVKTSNKSSFWMSSTVQDFQYDNNKKLIGITRNVYRTNSTSPISTYIFTFKDEKIFSYVETVKGITAAPHEFKDGKLVKSIIEGGYKEYEYDNLGRLIKVTTTYKGKVSSIKLSYQEGKSFLSTIPKFKGFPEFINNWRQFLPLTPVPDFDLFHLESLYKEISTFDIEGSKEVEQFRTTLSYTLNKEGFPTTLHTEDFYRDSKGVWANDPSFSPRDMTFTYIDCD